VPVLIHAARQLDLDQTSTKTKAKAKATAKATAKARFLRPHLGSILHPRSNVFDDLGVVVAAKRALAGDQHVEDDAKRPQIRRFCVTF
jgi:hypothetical protein